MTGDETAQLLAYCAGVDPRFNTADIEQAQARVVTWADTLDGVDARFALDKIRAFYRSTQQWSITPGAIRSMWLTEQARRDTLDRAAARARAIEAGTAPNPEPSDVRRAELARTRETIRAARAAMGWA